MASALNNLKRVDMPLNKETKETIHFTLEPYLIMLRQLQVPFFESLVCLDLSPGSLVNTTHLSAIYIIFIVTLSSRVNQKVMPFSLVQE